MMCRYPLAGTIERLSHRLYEDDMCGRHTYCLDATGVTVVQSYELMRNFFKNLGVSVSREYCNRTNFFYAGSHVAKLQYLILGSNQILTLLVWKKGLGDIAVTIRDELVTNWIGSPVVMLFFVFLY